jgi:hypothetical protein
MPKFQLVEWRRISFGVYNLRNDTKQADKRGNHFGNRCHQIRRFRMFINRSNHNGEP